MPLLQLDRKDITQSSWVSKPVSGTSTDSPEPRTRDHVRGEITRHPSLCGRALCTFRISQSRTHTLSIQHCYSSDSYRTLFYVWRRILNFQNGSLRVTAARRFDAPEVSQRYAAWRPRSPDARVGYRPVEVHSREHRAPRRRDIRWPMHLKEPVAHKGATRNIDQKTSFFMPANC